MFAILSKIETNNRNIISNLSMKALFITKSGDVAIFQKKHSYYLHDNTHNNYNKNESNWPETRL